MDERDLMLITHKDIVGAMAMWAVRQHPYGRPEGLFDITERITAEAQKWDIGPASLKMRRFTGWREIEDWLRGALHEHPILDCWNTPLSGHTQQIVASSRYWEPKPEDDFIDIDALLRNVALSVWRIEEAEKAGANLSSLVATRTPAAGA